MIAALAPPSPPWRQQAACRGWAPRDGTTQPHPFFPVNGWPGDDALALCRACPVAGPCGEAGAGEQGLWGGGISGVGSRRSCARCRVGFAPLQPNQRYCTRQCRERAR